MPGFALLLLQAAATTATVPDERLLHPVPHRQCEAGGSDILVCARDQDAYRLHGAGPEIEPILPPKAEWRLFGNTKMNIHGVERPVGGVAAMATVTVPF
jgi:hypothetical protein